MKSHYPGCQLDDKCTCQDFDDQDVCEGCGDGDKVPAKGYFICPVCDAEWPDEEEDSLENADGDARRDTHQNSMGG